MSRSKRFLLLVLVFLITIVLVLKNNEKMLSMLLSDSYNNLSQIKLNASWQFFSVNTWQVPDKENPQSQNYLTSAKTSFQNQTNESLTEQLFIIQTKPPQTIIISSGKGIIIRK